MSILAIDYGDSHLGLAFSPDGKVGYPLFCVNTKAVHEKIKKAKEVCDEHEVSQIVIGLPLDQKGELSEEAKKVKRFGEKLNQSSGIEVSYRNETLTSTEALKRMLEAGVPRDKRKELEHSFAAQIILEEYLGSENYKHKAPSSNPPAGGLKFKISNSKLFRIWCL